MLLRVGCPACHGQENMVLGQWGEILGLWVCTEASVVTTRPVQTREGNVPRISWLQIQRKA